MIYIVTFFYYFIFQNHVIRADTQYLVGGCQLPIESSSYPAQKHVSGVIRSLPSRACPFCSDLFITKRSLTSHLEQEHHAKQRLKCHLCGKMFANKITLNDHIDRHNGNQAFFCQMCDLKFSERQKFEGHMNIHKGIKPYECPGCLRSFTHSNTLSKHKKTCTGMVVL